MMKVSVGAAVLTISVTGVWAGETERKPVITSTM